MIWQITDYYSHEFIEEEGVIAANFTTRTGTEYRVYFYPALDYFDYIHPDSIIAKNGYYFGFTKVAPNEDKKEQYDPRIMNTIVNVINEFYDSQGNNCILIFHCSDDWGNDKKLKRATRFDEWFHIANLDALYKKYNEEIDVNEYIGHDGVVITDKEYMSLIIHIKNQNSEKALEEFHQIKAQIIAGK